MMDINEKRALYLGVYEKESIDSKIADGIEKYGYCKIRLVDKNGNSVTGKKIAEKIV